MIYLLIDDNIIDLLVNEKIIQNSDSTAEVIKKSSASDALKWLESADPADLPDVILLDIKMPFMDGFDFLNAYQRLSGRIREHNIRIFMLSSSIDPADIEKSDNSEIVEGFIEKPLSKEGLRKYVSL